MSPPNSTVSENLEDGCAIAFQNAAEVRCAMEFTERFWDREPTVLLCGLKPVATSPGSVSFLLYLLAGTVQATTNFI